MHSLGFHKNPLELTEECHLDGQIAALIKSLTCNPHFDAKACRQLVDDTDAETVLAILALFTKNLNSSYMALNINNVSSRSDEVQKIAHRIAGTAELLGFRALGALARELQFEFKMNPLPEDAGDKLNKFKTYMDETIRTVQTSCPSLDCSP